MWRTKCTKNRRTLSFRRNDKKNISHQLFVSPSVFRARVIAVIRQARFIWPNNIPNKWVVDCKHVGKGLPALAYRHYNIYHAICIAVSSARKTSSKMTASCHVLVTFQYLDSESGTIKTRCEKGERFLWLLFQHALPKRFRRVRDYGFCIARLK